MTVNFKDAIFKSTGSTTSRTHGNRAAEVINVKDYGAVGDASTNDRAAIQAAIDAAFGTAASPHGYTDRALNKALYFPAGGGGYAIHSGLVFTNVYGGLIYGDNTGIACVSGSDAAFIINGMVETRIEGLSFYSGSSSVANVDLDWDGTWADLPVANTNGLRHNVISNSQMGTSNMGIRVANSGNDGSFNTFVNVIVQSTQAYGIELVGTGALGNMVIGGGTSVGASGVGKIGYKATGGQFSVLAGIGNGGNWTDIQIDSNYPCAILGGRCETNAQFLKVSAGNVMVQGFCINDGGINAAHITGGRVIFDGCFNGAGQTLTGTGGTVYIRGCPAFPSTAAYTGGGGTVAQNI